MVLSQDDPQACIRWPINGALQSKHQPAAWFWHTKFSGITWSFTTAGQKCDPHKTHLNHRASWQCPLMWRWSHRNRQRIRKASHLRIISPSIFEAFWWTCDRNPLDASLWVQAAPILSGRDQSQPYRSLVDAKVDAGDTYPNTSWFGELIQGLSRQFDWLATP